MPIREMNVERRRDGTIDGAIEYHIQYSVRPDPVSAPLRAPEFLAAALLAAPGAPSETVFVATSGAVRAYGRALASTDDQHDEHVRFVTSDAATFSIVYRYLPPSGAPVIRTYDLASVIAAPGAPSQGDFDAMTAFLISYGDAAAGYAP